MVLAATSSSSCPISTRPVHRAIVGIPMSSRPTWTASPPSEQCSAVRTAPVRSACPPVPASQPGVTCMNWRTGTTLLPTSAVCRVGGTCSQHQATVSRRSGNCIFAATRTTRGIPTSASPCTCIAGETCAGSLFDLRGVCPTPAPGSGTSSMRGVARVTTPRTTGRWRRSQRTSSAKRSRGATSHGP